MGGGGDDGWWWMIYVQAVLPCQGRSGVAVYWMVDDDGWWWWMMVVDKTVIELFSSNMYR